MGVDEKALGQRLQKARQSAGLTQQELCQKAGLSYSTLAKIERGAIKAPSVFTVAAIAAATDMPLEKLLGIQSPSSADSAKKTSLSGVKFVYMDIGGTMKHSIHKDFTDIARAAGEPVEMVEILFWRHHDAVASGRTSLAEFNALMAQELSLKSFDWLNSYITNAEPMPHTNELVGWIADNYRLGILSNNFPGVIDELLRQKILPDVAYETVVDSSKVGLVKPQPEIYTLAQKMAGVAPNEILFIDNERPNLTAADQAGWQILWFDEADPAGSVEKIRAKLAF